MEFREKTALFILCLISSLFMLLIDAQAPTCGPCFPSNCLDIGPCRGGEVYEPCGCCKECAKQEGEICGGLFNLLGICDEGLACVKRTQSLVFNGMVQGGNGTCESIDTDLEDSWPPVAPLGSIYSSEECETAFSGCDIHDGTCMCAVDIVMCENPFEYATQLECDTALEKTSPLVEGDCSKVLCEVTFEAYCPEDSTLQDTPMQPGECCPRPPTCSCNLSNCYEILCSVGYEKRLVQTGDGNPGTCCDTYECQPQERIPDCSGVECPDSPGKMCPSDSKMIMGGLSEDGCCLLPSRCNCALELCGVPSCWAGFAPKRMQEGTGYPGSCCDEYTCVAGMVTEGCIQDDMIFLDGDTWSVGDCKTCECITTMSHCVIAQSCYMLENKRLCVVQDGFKAPGDRWNEDDCTTCECQNGEVACTTPSCKVECFSPRKVPGICCPVCDEPAFITFGPVPELCPSLEGCTLLCHDGLAQDSLGCSICQCQDAIEMTTSLPIRVSPTQCPPFFCSLDCIYGLLLDQDSCPLCQCKPDFGSCPDTSSCGVCTNGYKQDEKGCDTCKCKTQRTCPPMDNCHKFCLYGYALGKNGCLRCKCEKCPPLDGCSKQCVLGYDTNDRGCPICKCRTSLTSTPVPTSSHMCESSSGGIYADGESWHDGCRQCYCHNGQEMCSLITCPGPICSQPHIKPDFCCPICDDSMPNILPPPDSTLQICHSLEGHFYVEGETWSMDFCTNCICHNGNVLCNTVTCPALPCASPVITDGKCCGMCAEDPSSVPSSIPELQGQPCIRPTSVGLQFFPSGTSWKEDDCNSCQCHNGVISCFSQTCPTVTCDTPVLKKGQCCPVCVALPRTPVCEFGLEHYVEGESWLAFDCVTCTCLQGINHCSKSSCPPVDCINPLTGPGFCCPFCRDETTPTPLSTNSLGSKTTEAAAALQRTSWSSDTISSTKKPSYRSSPTRGFLPPAAHAQITSPVLLILCIVLAICVFTLLLFILIKRKHRLFYDVNKKQMPMKPPEASVVQITSIKPKNTDFKPSNNDAVRDSIRDSTVFKENLANKYNVNSKLDAHEINRLGDKYGIGKKIDAV